MGASQTYPASAILKRILNLAIMTKVKTTLQAQKWLCKELRVDQKTGIDLLDCYKRILLMKMEKILNNYFKKLSIISWMETEE
jgi:hypothetical protein